MKFRDVNLQNISIGKRLFLAFSLITFIVFIGTGFILYNIRTIKELNSNLFNKNLKAIGFLLEADRDAYQSRLALYQSIHSNSAEQRKIYEADVIENLEQILTRYSKYAKIYNVSRTDKFIEQDRIFQTHYEQFKVLTVEVVKLLKEGKLRESLTIYDTEYKKHFEIMREAMNQSTELLSASAKADHEYVIKIVLKVFSATMGICVLFLLVISFSGFFITRSITVPLQDLVNSSNQIAEGNLWLQIESKGKDEIASVYAAYENMISKLRKMIESIRLSSSELTTASSAIAASAENTSQSSVEQAAAVEQIAAAIDQMASSINQTTNSAKLTENIARKTTGSILLGQESLNKLVLDMKEVEGKISMINGIADKTNLLAVNAAIEAARADEFGTGFAVVATEVRKLAVTSQKAAIVINELISANTKNITSFQKQIKEIVLDFQKITDLLQEISYSSSEQNSSINQINASVQQINSVTLQNSASAEELSASGIELESQAKNLLDVVSFFIINKKDKSDKIIDMKNQMQQLIENIKSLEGNL
ncbi:MAG: methyl-accepting chemotaxis protein [Leptospiraceae bacterium]|nr:methyl-accepting chemotaxis protein [Leptospiraceae bacterium]MCP5501788.1 methyl-accepting chemotaxis protein [Leptospiraceae bacterium]